MSIVRLQKRDHPYVQIDKRCLEDTRLSWKSKGILSYLLSRPDDWTVMFEQLQKVSTDGKSSIRSAFKELVEYGYCERKILQKIDDEGKSSLMGSEYVIYEVPNSRKSETLEVEKPREPENLNVRESNTTNNELLTNNEVSSNKQLTKTAIELEPIDIFRDSPEEIDRKFEPYPPTDKMRFFIYAWHQIYGHKPKENERKHRDVKKALKDYKASEIIYALKNRKNDPWLEEQGIMGTWNKFWEHGDKIEEYMSRDYTKKKTTKTGPQGEKPFYGYNMPRDMY